MYLGADADENIICEHWEPLKGCIASGSASKALWLRRQRGTRQKTQSALIPKNLLLTGAGDLISKWL